MKRLFILALVCCWALPLRAQVPVVLAPNAKPQFLNNSGVPLAAGCIFTFAAGTTTPLASYTDSTGTVQNPNPIILDAGGFPPTTTGIWLSSAAYKLQAKSVGGSNCSTGSTIWTIDNINNGGVPLTNFTNIFTALQTFNAGITSAGPNTLNGGGALAGTYTHSGTETFTGNNTATCFSLLNGVAYVGGACSATDIGSQINSAYAALPQTGGTIIVLPKTDGTCYSYSTPIVANVSGKYLLLEGSAATNSPTAPAFGGGACLNYTPTTATAAITLDYVPLAGGNSQATHGIRDLTLWNNSCVTSAGCGSSANGIVVGITNGGIGGGYFSNVSVKGFNIGLSIPVGASANGWGAQFQFCTFYYNATGASILPSLENTHFIGGKFQLNGTGLVSQSEVYAVHVSFDGNTVTGVSLTNTGTSVAGPDFTGYGIHFENKGSTTPHFITGTGNWVLQGGILEDDAVSGTADFYVQCGGAWCVADDVFVAVNGAGARTVTQVLNASGANVRGYVRFINFAGTVPLTWVGGTNAAFITNLSFNANTSTAPNPWFLEANLKAPIGIGDAQFSCIATSILCLSYNGSVNDGLDMNDTTNVHRIRMGPGEGGTSFFAVRDVTNARQIMQYSFTTGQTQFPNGIANPNLLISQTAPTIAGAGCGGSAASIPNNNGTAAFTVNVGTAPTSACTVTLPTAATGWACFATDITTNSTAVFLQKQSGGTATTAIITNYSDVAVATAFTASDVLRVSCHGY